MAKVEQIINIIESIHKKRKRADLETIYKEAKEINLTKEDIEVLLGKLCENDVLRKVHIHGKYGFCFVAKASEVQKKAKRQYWRNSIEDQVGVSVNDNDNASDISRNNDWNKKNLVFTQITWRDYVTLRIFWRLR